MREIVSLHLGQAGVQMGLKFWETLSAEHGLRINLHSPMTACLEASAEDLPFGDLQTEKLDAFFHETPSTSADDDDDAFTVSKFSVLDGGGGGGGGGSGRVPRCILVDGDFVGADDSSAAAGVVEGHAMKRVVTYEQGRRSGVMFPKAIAGDGPTTGRAAVGSSTGGNNGVVEDSELIRNTMEAIRKIAEACDSMQGFHVTHGVSGGTGGRFFYRFLGEVKDEYPDRCILSTSVFPASAAGVGSLVDPYHSVLALQQLVENADAAICFDNTALYGVCLARMHMTVPGFDELNALVASALSGVTTPLRFPGQTCGDLSTMVANLVEQPNLHFLCPSFAPLSSLEDEKLFTVPELTAKLFAPSHCFLCCDPSDELYMGLMANFRGEFPEPGSAEASRQLEQAKKANFKQHRLSKFCQGRVKCAVCPVPVPGFAASAAMVANSPAVDTLLERTLANFRALFRRKAYMYPFYFKGFEDSEFQEAESALADLLGEYEDLRRSASGNSGSGAGSLSCKTHFCNLF